MHNFAVSRCSGIREVVDSRVVFLLAYGWRFLCEAAGPADVELLGFCELQKKKILLRENPYPWHPKNPAWLCSPLVCVSSFNTLAST